MCEYCESDKKGYVKHLYDVAYGDFATMGFYPATKEVCVEVDAFGKLFTNTFKINYCPMCGRRLNNG